MVREWPELNRALFWNCVAEERARRKRENGERLTDYWHLSIFGAYWAFDGSDFDYVVEQIAARPLTDDKLVALSLAFKIHQQNRRPRAWRERLKKAAAIDPELETELQKLLNPPKGAAAKFRREQAAWKRRSDREAAKEAKAKQKAKEILASRVAAIRDFGQPGKVSQDQYYLHEQMRSGESQHNRWTDGNWRSLIETFGEDVARAFRDGAVGYWRQPAARPTRSNRLWKELMRRSLGFDVLACPRCGGHLRLIALIEEAAVIGRILRYLGLPTDLPMTRPARAPPLFAAEGNAQADDYESAP